MEESNVWRVRVIGKVSCENKKGEVLEPNRERKLSRGWSIEEKMKWNAGHQT